MRSRIMASLNATVVLLCSLPGLAGDAQRTPATGLAGDTQPAPATGLAGDTQPAPATGPAAEEARLIEQFDRWAASQVESAVKQPASNEAGGIAWGSSYQLAALAEMLDATRDPKYARLFATLADWVIEARDDRRGRRDQIRGRVVPAWGSTKYSGGRYYAWAVHTGMIVAPMAHYAAVVRRDPDLSRQFAEHADRYLRIAEESIAVHDDQYRAGPGPDEGYLFGLFLNKHLPLNQQNAPARAWIYIDDASRGTKYRERTTRLACFLKNRLRLTDDAAYVWDYWAPLEGPGKGLEDTSHAAINVDFMLLCHERGIVFTREDVRRLEKTLLTNTIRSDGRVADNVGGTGGVDRYRTAALVWGRLARYSPQVREKLVHLHRTLGPAGTPGELLGTAYLVSATRTSSN